MADGKDIGDAVQMMRNGAKVRRAGWNGKGMYIFMTLGDAEHEPYITMFTAQKRLQPGWVCSQADLLARDWEMVDD